MAASAGTNTGSTPVGVGVGVGVVDWLADGVGEADESGEGDPLSVGVGVGFTADADVHPAMTTAMAIPTQAWMIRRDRVPSGM